MRSPAALLPVLVCLLLPAAAAAQDPAVGPTGPAAVTPPPAPPAQGKLTIRAERVGPVRTVMAGARWRVRGTLVPYVAGQKAVVRFTRGTRRLRARTVTLLPSRSGKSGSFVVGFATRGPGRVDVRASHAGTPGLATAVARPTSVDVLPARARPGTTGRGVRVLQQHLRRLGYVVGRSGSYDARTARAVVAFRKVAGMARTPVADRAMLRRLAAGKGAFRVRYPGHGRHVEGDVRHQVVALIGAGGRVERIYPTSSGAPSTPTILGSFAVYRKDFGTNQLGMVHAAYFAGGYAIHGYHSVPTYNASHGCLRVPVPDALGIFRWVRYGTRVDTYR